MSLEENIDTALNDMSAGIHASQKDNEHKYCEEHIAEAKRAILALIKDLVQECKPEQSSYKDGKFMNYNDAISEFEQNILKVLEKQS